jgi:hypothetical protein
MSVTATTTLEKTKTYLRRAYVTSRENDSIRINLPKCFTKTMGYRQGEYFRCYMSGTGKIVIERAGIS